MKAIRIKIDAHNKIDKEVRTRIKPGLFLPRVRSPIVQIEDKVIRNVRNKNVGTYYRCRRGTHGAF